MPFDSGNPTFTHPGQYQMQVEVILASKPATDTGAKPLYTIRLRYPRIIHGEVMAHRVFSRNARSSRAVPVKTMLMETTTIPFIPWHWHKNQKGMQGKIPLTEAEIIEAKRLWLEARDSAVSVVEQLFDPAGLNIHKQNPNRLLEPFSWIDVLITSADWDNFIWLRDHEDAEPHLQDLARLVKQAIDAAEVQELEPGEWHLPYITEEDLQELPIHKGGLEVLQKVSSARCARISYKPFGGESTYEAELERYNMLVSSDRVHASPLEHQACADSRDELGNWEHPELHGNLPGYIQFRKLIPNECYKGEQV